VKIQSLQTYQSQHFTLSEVIKAVATNRFPIRLGGCAGSSYAVIIASLIRQISGSALIICNDKEKAAYFLNDLEVLSEGRNIHFFPSAYQRSVKFGKTDPGSIILRTDVLRAISQGENVVVVTYPEALLEKVISPTALQSRTLVMRKGEKLNFSFVHELLEEFGFERVDFVYEPGQYALRGGIIDVFSFSHEYPVRADFFGDEIDSLRRFDIDSQLSIQVIEEVTIIPDVRAINDNEFASFADLMDKEWVVMVEDFQSLAMNLGDMYDDILRFKPKEEKDSVNLVQLIETDVLVKQLLNHKRIEWQSQGNRDFKFDTVPQPRFQKNFDLLFKDVAHRCDSGYKIHILSNSDKQIERLRDIFATSPQKLQFTAVSHTLHEGFIDHEARCCFYTDHEIFERYHKFVLRSENLKSSTAAFTIKELNQFNPGDFVVHIDHGVGRFDGLARTEVNGNMQEVVRLSFKDGDVLFVSVQSLHKLSKYKGKDGEPPTVSKLGSGAWQKLKDRTKSKVKDIARDLIKLYAKRRSEKGFAFSADNYLQKELEASFIYEDTPDQFKATQATKEDMERDIPMDRLVCGDVGFGKTEIAIRAAFKAACDNKQVAVLVPTTILAFQHAKTFKERLKDFPVTIDYLSRFRTAAETKEILQKVADGKIDILIGTHKLTSKDVKFKDLGLMIIDEEQKFGVAIKEKLKVMKVNVDTLTLTATPIPRTLQFSLMGARDLSIMQTPPPNRYPIQTEVHSFNDDIIREAIYYELDRNGQVFFINNRISNLAELETLIKRLVPGVRCVCAHGQMDGKKLEEVMLGFIDGKYDVLIATAIIESGLDIPNANTIIINDAQNFGLSDLHQLRGRVGRSNKRAFCYLLAPPVSVLPADSRRRLVAIESYSELGSGFQISLQDLDIRGAGNLLGAEQSGYIADIGIETYHQILNEAVHELRDEEFSDLFATESSEPDDHMWARDCNVETDIPLMFPSEYINNTPERISLYRELDGIANEEQLAQFITRLTDRFGPPPPEALQLIEVLRLRWLAEKLGVEKITLRNNRLNVYFIANPQSPFYSTSLFQRLLQKLHKGFHGAKLKETNGKLAIVFQNVSSIKQSMEILKQLHEQSE
jgi:transcription-repair coupling factor (superfamily II helicase)